MTLNEIFGLSGVILGSLGGGVAIIFGFSSWLGKVWAGRILQTEKAVLQNDAESFKKDLQKEIEFEKSKLQQDLEKAKAEYQLETEKNKAKFLRYSETQFKLYNDLWMSLCDLESTSEELWDTATSQLVLKLKTDLSKAKKAVKHGFLLIEKNHYNQLLAIIERFENFQFGKSRLIRLRKEDLNNQNISEHQIRDTIKINRETREDYSTLLESVGTALKNQIRA